VKQDATTGETNTKPAVYLTTNAEGRPSGEAFVEVDSEADLEEALKLNNNLMGQRYIEIFRSDTQQLKQHTQESMNNASNWSEPVLRLRGLPYGCTKADIETFFQGNCFRKRKRAFVQFELFKLNCFVYYYYFYYFKLGFGGYGGYGGWNLLDIILKLNFQSTRITSPFPL